MQQQKELLLKCHQETQRLGVPLPFTKFRSLWQAWGWGSQHMLLKSILLELQHSFSSLIDCSDWKGYSLFAMAWLAKENLSIVLVFPPHTIWFFHGSKSNPTYIYTTLKTLLDLQADELRSRHMENKHTDIREWTPRHPQRFQCARNLMPEPKQITAEINLMRPSVNLQQVCLKASCSFWSTRQLRILEVNPDYLERTQLP